MKACNVAIKIVNHHLKMSWSHDINLWRSLKDLELVCRHESWTKNNLEILFMSYSNMQLNFILILKSIQEKQLKHFLLCRNVYDGVMFFELCRFMKKKKILIFWEQNAIFSVIKVFNSLGDKSYILGKINLLAEVTFKTLSWHWAIAIETINVKDISH